MDDIKPGRIEQDKDSSAERNFKLLANTLPDLVFIVDRKFEATFLNERYAQFTGNTIESGLGAGWQSILHDDDRAGAMALWHTSLSQGVAYQCEQRIKGADDEYVWHLVRALPVYDDQNNIVSFFGTCTDIHYKKQSREELERVVTVRTKELNEAKMRTEQILESIGDAIILSDLDGNLTYVNQAAREMFIEGVHSLTQSAQRRRMNAVDGSPLKREQLPLSRALGGELISDTEMLLREEGVEDRVVSVVARPFKDAAGTIHGAVVALRNITPRKNQELALERARDEARLANKLKTEFVANISHEIRTPMSGILGLTEILVSETEGTSQEIAGHILSSAQNLMHLVNDLLDLSKLEAGRLDIRNERFSIGQIVDDVLTSFYVNAKNKSIKLTADVGSELEGDFLGDGHRIRQVMHNLVQNALKFTEVGSITVSAHLQKEEADRVQVRFSVKDSGLGISQINQSKLFQLFVQVDGSSTRRYGGTGLGLFLCKRIIELMNGIIGVDSVENEGADFWFSIPLLRIEQI